jgi:hypothetical protein
MLWSASVMPVFEADGSCACPTGVTDPGYNEAAMRFLL